MHMSGESLLIILVVGLIAGWLAGHLPKFGPPVSELSMPRAFGVGHDNFEERQTRGIRAFCGPLFESGADYTGSGVFRCSTRDGSRMAKTSGRRSAPAKANDIIEGNVCRIII